MRESRKHSRSREAEDTIQGQWHVGHGIPRPEVFVSYPSEYYEPQQERNGRAKKVLIGLLVAVAAVGAAGLGWATWFALDVVRSLTR